MRGTKLWSVFNGAIHWLALSPDAHEYLTVAFDLMERKFVEIPFLDDIDVSKDYGLWVFRGFPSLWVLEDLGKVDIWVGDERIQSAVIFD
ncbi:hypothetical protein MtrunA17_Chr1g0176671 [Medicago truncatula]|uniref:Uncharacterized protein n=1 Tax=Medicago truncatula TaxID=3880 RepID=A0A396JT25_MEDTR|nr:hypothetical protein MtrunA17_Chr1g0176671 [Medicago truncatula]